MNTLRNILLMLCLSITLAYGQGHDHGDHGHDHGDHGHDHDDHGGHDDGPGHDDHGPGSVAVTIWNDSHEYFIEYGMPAAGETVDMLIHITHLAGWQAVKQGELEIVQIPERGPAKTTRLDAPIRPGIYKTSLKFPIAGNWQVDLKMLDAGQVVSQTRIPVEVFQDENHFPSEDDHADHGVSLLKEQQWRTAFNTQPVTRRPLYNSISGNGVLMPTTQGQARVSAPLRGRFEIADVMLGAQVKQGQVLGYLQPTLGQADDPAGLNAAVAQAELAATYAEQEHARLKRLHDREIVAAARVREAEKEWRLAQQHLTAAKQRLQQASAAPNAAHRQPLIAPIAGTLVAIDGVSGSFVESGTTLFRIVDLSTIWLKAQVPASQLAGQAQPQDALFQLEGSTEFIRISDLGGKLLTVGSIIDPETRRMTVIYQLPNPQKTMRVGAFAEVSLLLGDGKPQIAIPRSAVLEEKGQAMVYVQTGGESFESRWVRLGSTQGDWVQVVDGLNEGERVVTQGAYGVQLASKADVVPDHGHAH